MKHFLLVSICIIISCSWADNQKPIFHITADDGHWINDPNGPFYDYVHREYHLFAQYNPFSSVWGNMSWAHWISKDLVKWKRLPVALFNDQDYDFGGAFSGSAILIEDVVSWENPIPILIYTCVDGDNRERQCIAISANTSDPEQILWKKSSQNPIIDYTSLPEQYNDLNFRDPAIWSKTVEKGEGVGYWVSIAAKLNQTGNVVLYDCSFKYDSNVMDFKTECKYFSQLWKSSDSSYITEMVECPDFYPVPVQKDKASKSLMVLKYSVMEDRKDLYEIGEFDEADGKFIKDLKNHNFSKLEYDFGPNNHYYASKTFSVAAASNAKGKIRRILWGWSPENDATANTPLDKNWSGSMSLPREVTYSDIWKVLLFNPIHELTTLRKISTHYHADMNNLIINGCDDLSSGEYTIPLRVSSKALEVRATFHVDFSVLHTFPDCGIEVGFLGRTSSAASYESVVKGIPSVYTKHSIMIEHQEPAVAMYSVIDLTKSGGNTIPTISMKNLPGNLDAWLAANHNNNQKDTYGIDVDIILYYDHSIVEFYAMGGVSASTARIYPNDDMVGLSVYVKTCDNESQRVVLHSLDTWELNSIW